MPEAGFDRNINLPSGGGKYFRLKAKGDKIKFLIANTPHFETKHWVSDREAVMCDRYNGQGKNAVCKNCEQYKDLLALAGDEKDKVEQANKLKPQVTFFYPVLDLKTDEPVIFQTSPSVHWTIVGYKEEGVDVFNCAWSVERTEEPGKYYEVRRLDTIKLTKEQDEALVLAKQIVLSKGQVSSSIVEETDN
jgi:hypothetical protein